MVHRGQKFARPPPPQSASFRSKKNSASLLSSIQQLWRECLPAFSQQRVAQRAQALSLSSLLCLGRHTVTGLLTTGGQEFHDWSADYRLFSHTRLPTEEIFSVIRRAVLQQLPAQAPLCVAIDDTLLRKTGLRVPGVGWRRDPLGPHFQTNFVRAQRVLQLCADIPLPDGQRRMVPISFISAPTPVKPSAKASAEEHAAYRSACRQACLSRRASRQIVALRQAVDGDAAAVDGSRPWRRPARTQMGSHKTPRRQSTQQAINQLRGEVWGRALGLTHFSDLLTCTPPTSKPEKFVPHLPSAILYAVN